MGRVDGGERPARRGLNPVYLSGLAAGAWVALAFFRPELTFHLGPVLVGVLFPVGHRLSVRHRLTPVQAVATFVGGAINVGLATALLGWTGKLEGPSLLPFGGPALEAVVFGLAAAAVGAVVVALPIRWPGES